MQIFHSLSDGSHSWRELPSTTATRLHSTGLSKRRHLFKGHLYCEDQLCKDPFGVCRTDLVGPERREDEVHFNEDGAEREDPPHHDDHQWLHKPTATHNGEGVPHLYTGPWNDTYN